MKLIYVFLILFLMTSVSAAPLIDVTNYNPYPNENLACKYMAFQPGDILKFVWYKNGNKVREEIKDKNTDILLPNTIGGTARLDKINCDVHWLDPATNLFQLKDNNRELDGLVTVGEYECNDGLDNDDDNNIDFQDPHCNDRTDNMEQEHPRLLIQRFCNEHPNNFLCLEMGYRNIISLCTEFTTSPFCAQEEIDPNAFQAQCNVNPILCNGVDDIATYCGDVFDNGNLALICTLILQTTATCEADNECGELNNNDKENLCKIDDNYDFCRDFVANVGDRCDNRRCANGLVCNDNKICENAFCRDGDTRKFECRNGIEIEQECEGNDWIGECPKSAECQSGKTKRILCSDGKEITQTCKNFKWTGNCPNLQIQQPNQPPRTQNDKTPTYQQPQKDQEPVQIQEPKTQWPLIVFILVLAIILAALAFYMPSKKQKPKKR